MSEFWQGFLAGGLVAILAFILAIAWEFWRDHRRTKAQSRAAMGMLLDAARRSRDLLVQNVRLLEEELRVVTDGKLAVEAIQRVDRLPFQTFAATWAAIRGTTELGDNVCRLSGFLDGINEQISSRELVRTSGATLWRLRGRMRLLDGLIIDESRRAVDSLESLIEHMERSKPNR